MIKFNVNIVYTMLNKTILNLESYKLWAKIKTRIITIISLVECTFKLHIIRILCMGLRQRMIEDFVLIFQTLSCPVKYGWNLSLRK